MNYLDDEAVDTPDEEKKEESSEESEATPEPEKEGVTTE